ncbi:hypothetical protein V6259_12835 [Marinomonas sp. TI.3.20]|uniref:hypothetical protein n=1 Tax=Marinomonas sp. TI.3.20 TaxID=3121296 RepID=UPI00311D6460
MSWFMLVFCFFILIAITVLLRWDEVDEAKIEVLFEPPKEAHKHDPVYFYEPDNDYH